MRSQLAQSKDLSFRSAGNGQDFEKDRVIVMRARFLLASRLIGKSPDRAFLELGAALGQHWHAAIPVLRLYQMEDDSTTNSERKVVRDVQIHGGRE